MDPGPSAAPSSARRAGTIADLGVLCALALLLGLATFASLRAAAWLRRILASTGIHIATRLMGLIIAAIAPQLTVEGVVLLIRG